jgi:ketosteroid isomerase-like protein
MNSPLHEQIMAGEEWLRQAMLHSDVPALDELIAPDLLFTSHLGQLVRKEDDLAFHRARLLRLSALEPSEQQIQLYPGFAVVSVLMHLVGTYEGTPVDQRLRYTRFWAVTPDGRLQIIAGHASELPPT